MVLVGSYSEDKGIYKLDISESGEINLVDNYYSGANPSYLLKRDNEIISVNEISDELNLSRFLLNSDKDPLRTGSFKAGGEGPCHLLNIGKDLILCSNYDNGSLSLLRVDEENIEILDNIRHEGSSIVSDRQEASHIHSTAYHKRYDVIYCIDLGTDEVVSYKIDSSNKLTKTESVSHDPGDGPRLMIVDDVSNKGYVVNELSNTISVYELKDDGTMVVVNKVSTLPENCKVKSFASHIEFSPCGKYILVSNRGYDSIAIFKIDNFNLSSPQWFSSEGVWPRHFSFHGENQVIVANQESNTINSFSYNDGKLIYSGYCLNIDKPTMILSV